MVRCFIGNRFGAHFQFNVADGRREREWPRVQRRVESIGKDFIIHWLRAWAGINVSRQTRTVSSLSQEFDWIITSAFIIVCCEKCSQYTRDCHFCYPVLIILRRQPHNALKSYSVCSSPSVSPIE